MPRRRLPSQRALTADEQRTVLARLHELRFVDLAPAEVYATLLDEGAAGRAAGGGTGSGAGHGL